MSNHTCKYCGEPSDDERICADCQVKDTMSHMNHIRTHSPELADAVENMARHDVEMQENLEVAKKRIAELEKAIREAIDDLKFGNPKMLVLCEAIKFNPALEYDDDGNIMSYWFDEPTWEKEVDE